MGAQHRIRGCMQRPDTASAPPHQCTPANPAATITRSARFDRTFSRAPSKPNPHSARLHLSQLPAGSFPGGFPTTAPAQAAPSTAGRRPKPFTCVDGSGLARRTFTLQRWSEQPCVRPVSAVHMTAGHNALRGSGPGQKHAFEDAVAHVGCPDRRIDRRCITCCSPSQPSRHAGVSGCDLVYAARAAGSL